MIRLGDTHLEIVKKILRFHVPDGFQAYAFGSRAKDKNVKTHSDLDLCLKGKRPLTSHELVALRDAFTNSDLPMRVDVLDWADTDQKLQDSLQSDWQEVQF